MRYLLLGLLILAAGCHRSSPTHSVPLNKAQAPAGSAPLHLPDIRAIPGHLPLYLDKTAVADSSSRVSLPEPVHQAILETVRAYYTACAGDDQETYFQAKDVYYRTIRMDTGTLQLYLVLLRHIPDGAVNSRLLFFDGQAGRLLGGVVDFNLHALYDYDSTGLKPSKLKAAFGIAGPELAVADLNGDPYPDFRCTRLYHNGTANSLETLLLTVRRNRLDTLGIQSTPLP